MCRCVSESRRSPTAFSAEWLNDSGQVVHPAAPLGVGGPGSFRSAGVFASDGGAELLPHPRSPAVKMGDPSLVRQAEELEAAYVVRQAPPLIASPITETIRGMTVTVKKDATGEKDVGDALTFIHNTPTGKASYVANDKNIVTSVSNNLTWAVEIQTRYGSKPEGNSAYGRGTTKADKDAGNVSLGFHESCHRNDFLEYLRNTATPVLNAKKDEKEADVAAAIEKYMAAWDTYFQNARDLTLVSTDEVGNPTMAQYDAMPAEE